MRLYIGWFCVLSFFFKMSYSQLFWSFFQNTEKKFWASLENLRCFHIFSYQDSLGCLLLEGMDDGGINRQSQGCQQHARGGGEHDNNYLVVRIAGWVVCFFNNNNNIFITPRWRLVVCMCFFSCFLCQFSFFLSFNLSSSFFLSFSRFL